MSKEVEVGGIGVLDSSSPLWVKCRGGGWRGTRSAHLGKLISSGGFLSAGLRGADGPRIEQQLGPLQHVAGIFLGRAAVEDVAIFVADVAAGEKDALGVRNAIQHRLQAANLAEYVERA